MGKFIQNPYFIGEAGLESATRNLEELVIKPVGWIFLDIFH